MEVRIADTTLARIIREPGFNGGLSEALAKAFRRRINFLLDATDERDLRAMASLHFEKLKGDRSHQHSIRLNDQWRLILEIEGKGSRKVIVVVGIEDYH